MSDKGEQMSQWLKDPTKDQNAETLAQAVLNAVTGLRRWFRSQVLQPGLCTGHYDEANGKFVLGCAPSQLDAEKVVTTTQVNVVSATSDTLTVPAGHAYKLIESGLMNTTRGPTTSMTYTPNGGTAAVWQDSGTSTGNAANVYKLIGSPTLTSVGGIEGQIWIQAGDTVEMSCDNYVGADGTRYYWTFEDYTVI